MGQLLGNDFPWILNGGITKQVSSECAENISDDIVVHRGNQSEHDQRLLAVLHKLNAVGLTLNPEKCEFRMTKLTFMGHTLSKDGISPSDDKIHAIKHASEPKTASEVRSFLGLVQFVARFIPDLSTVSEPLRMLTGKNEQFRWGPEQNKVFSTLKDSLTHSETLGYFDKDAVTQIITDASPVGLGAVLLQTQNSQPRIISYASRSLSEVERRYSQTEKESLAIVWACERFHVYLYCLKFEKLTDHKPLEFIYSERANPPARLSVGFKGFSRMITR
ncbi:hypothetical protein BSL78_15613 [Apostichopus japonicus]|uniref:Reverse transcriptase/retrotransposon-derived protein RNase H-like domain-containing protein n=1 Tax=Stichopus japonicus TaxID=307972 RepID=A0A2G8KHT5_STIJA|nr:hypothetical protein BSL78_15613 [Apostichopus japonicus]